MTNEHSTLTLPNHEIVTIALYLCGGETNYVDTEHVAVKAAMLAPGRYNWRHYPDQINIEIIRAFLSDAKKPKNKTLISGSGNQGWMLTEVGALYAREHVDLVQSADLRSERKSDAEKKWFKQEKARLLASQAARKVLNGDECDITSSDAENFFRIDEYISREARDRKITRVINAFCDDRELSHIVSVLRVLINKEITNG